MIDLTQRPEYFTWLSLTLDCVMRPPWVRVITKLRKDKDESDTYHIQAICAFSNWTPHSCEMHIASDGSNRWCSKKYIKTCFAYAFLDCNLSRVTGIVDMRNAEAFAFDTGLGFEVEGVAKDAMGDGFDAWILGFTRRKWRESRWFVDTPVVPVEEDNGQGQRSASAS